MTTSTLISIAKDSQHGTYEFLKGLYEHFHDVILVDVGNGFDQIVIDQHFSDSILLKIGSSSGLERSLISALSMVETDNVLFLHPWERISNKVSAQALRGLVDSEIDDCLSIPIYESSLGIIRWKQRLFSSTVGAIKISQSLLGINGASTCGSHRRYLPVNSNRDGALGCLRKESAFESLRDTFAQHELLVESGFDALIAGSLSQALIEFQNAVRALANKAGYENHEHAALSGYYLSSLKMGMFEQIIDSTFEHHDLIGRSSTLSYLVAEAMRGQLEQTKNDNLADGARKLYRNAMALGETNQYDFHLVGSSTKLSQDGLNNLKAGAELCLE